MGVKSPIYKTRERVLTEVLAAISMIDDGELEGYWNDLIGNGKLLSVTITNDKEFLDDEENQLKNRW